MRYLWIVICCVPWHVHPLRAQQITIHIVDGRTGIPLQNAQVQLATYKDFALGPLNLQIQSSGANYIVQLPSSVTEILLDRVTLHRTEYRTCTRLRNGDVSPVAKILSTGVSLTDDCNRATVVHNSPGEITFFVRPLTLTELISNWWAGAFNG